MIMNNSMRKKLKSKSGASLVLAILVFLICALVGSSILAAATASSGTLTTAWQNDKDVYTLKSAEKLFEPYFEGQTWKSGSYTNIDSTTGKIKDVPASSTMDTLYQYMCIVNYNNNGSANTVQTITYTLGNTSLNTTPVTATVTMDASYNITASFAMTGSSRTVELHLSAATGTGDTTRAKGAAVSWNQPIVTVK
jgi:hypothetical protein